MTDVMRDEYRSKTSCLLGTPSLMRLLGVSSIQNGALQVADCQTEFAQYSAKKTMKSVEVGVGRRPADNLTKRHLYGCNCQRSLDHLLFV
jgi:hypothetical protein